MERPLRIGDTVIVRANMEVMEALQKGHLLLDEKVLQVTLTVPHPGKEMPLRHILMLFHNDTSSLYKTLNSARVYQRINLVQFYGYASLLLDLPTQLIDALSRRELVSMNAVL